MFYFLLDLLVSILVQNCLCAGVDSGTTTNLATFNTGLFPQFRSVSGDVQIEERAELLIQEIERSNIDIWCLQEAFFADIQRQVYRALKDKYPYVLTATDLTVDDTASTTTACSQEELAGFLSCVGTECSGLEGTSFVVCSVFSCLAEIDSLPCRDCISLYGLENGPDLCTTLKASRFETNYGLMLLSRKELRNTGVSGFNNQSQFRGYLEASVNSVGDLVCTHLSAFFPFYVGPPVVSPPLYSNYDTQQYDELLTLFELLTSKETAILMGDINNGPGSPGNAWQLPWHYGLINARGFVSPYVLKDGRCTFCTDNPSVASGGFQSSQTLDHIFLTTDTSQRRVISAKRILDDVQLLESGNPLSDHYGVKLTLRNIRSSCTLLDRIQKFYCPKASRPQLLPLPAPEAELNRLCVATS